ncbi:hypothetical protein B9J07_36400 [Sinorhizobium sp. LM21]|nr:hypothetical protein B9J07_36400 [Sinorhizobium sp. LM21]
MTNDINQANESRSRETVRDLVKRLSGIYRNRCPVNPKSAVCLYSKTLEEQSFCWPGISAARIRLDHSQLMALLAGLDWKKIRPTKVRRPLLTG